MIRKLRAMIAVTVGVVILLLTLGRVRIDWRGTQSSDEGSDEAPIAAGEDDGSSSDDGDPSSSHP